MELTVFQGDGEGVFVPPFPGLAQTACPSLRKASVPPVSLTPALTATKGSALSLKVTGAAQSAKEKWCSKLGAIAFKFVICGVLSAKRSFLERSFSYRHPIRNAQFLRTPSGSTNRENDSVILHISLTSRKWVLVTSNSLCVKLK